MPLADMMTMLQLRGMPQGYDLALCNFVTVPSSDLWRKTKRTSDVAVTVRVSGPHVNASKQASVRCPENAYM